MLRICVCLVSVVCAIAEDFCVQESSASVLVCVSVSICCMALWVLVPSTVILLNLIGVEPKIVVLFS